MTNKFKEIENIDLDYLDTVYREKLKFGKKEEILIKLK